MGGFRFLMTFFHVAASHRDNRTKLALRGRPPKLVATELEKVMAQNALRYRLGSLSDTLR